MTEYTADTSRTDKKKGVEKATHTDGWQSLGHGLAVGALTTVVGFVCGAGTSVLPLAALASCVYAVHHYGRNNGARFNTNLTFSEETAWGAMLSPFTYQFNHEPFSIKTRITEVFRKTASTAGLAYGAYAALGLAGQAMQASGFTVSPDFAGAAQNLTIKGLAVAAGGYVGWQVGGMAGTFLAPFAHAALVLKKRFS